MKILKKTSVLIMKKSVKILALTLFMLSALYALPERAGALSCRQWEDSYVVSCGDGSCKTEFRISNAATMKACGRRVVVEDPPRWISETIEEMVMNTLPTEQPEAVFFVTVLWPYLPPIPDEPAGFTKSLEKLLEEKRFTVTRSEKTVKELRTDYEERAAKELRAIWIRNGLNIATALAALLISLASLVWYIRSTKSKFRDGPRRGGANASLLIQLTIFVTAFSLLVFMPWQPTLMILFIPVILVIWAVELLVYLYFRLTKDLAKTKATPPPT
jgi:hypothetical protein